MKWAFILVVVVCWLALTIAEGESKNNHIIDILQRVRRAQAGVNYGFPTFNSYGPNSRGSFGEMPDFSEMKGQVWVSKSCVYDDKGKPTCVEQRGDKPKNDK